MYRSLFSYWLNISGPQADRDQFHQNFISHPLTDPAIELTANTEDESLYEVSPNEGATEEWNYADKVVRECLKDLPELKVTLDCINEEDHADETVYAWYQGKEVSSSSAVSIKSPESLLAELTEERQTPPAENQPYVVFIKSTAVRDVQYAVVTDPESINNGHWVDYPDAKLFLGVVFAATKEIARQKGAEYAGTPIENIGAEPVFK